MSQRFKASLNVEHPCCYEATVRDTSAKCPSYRDPSEWKGVVYCECYDMEAAILIATALNKLTAQ